MSHEKYTARPGQLWKGKKPPKERLHRKEEARLLRWALKVKPGDYIATCEGTNRKVTEVEPIWHDGLWKTGHESGSWMLDEVRFTDNRGRWHHCPGGGCALPPETPAEITAFYQEWTSRPDAEAAILSWSGGDAEQAAPALANWRKFKTAIESGQPIVDEFGELLPEFDSPV